MKIKLSPSILSADFSKLGEQMKLVEPVSDMFHVDVMDGHFVPNLTIGVPVVKSLRKITELQLDVHLMIDNPKEFIEPFANAGADMITVHVEVLKDNGSTIDKIHELGKKAGISLNPGTSLEMLDPYLDKVDLVLIMSVEPGFGGQGFIDVTDKIKELRSKYKGDIMVDGGINLETGKKVVDAGANILVSGSFIFHSEDPAGTAKKLKEL